MGTILTIHSIRTFEDITHLEEIKLPIQLEGRSSFETIKVRPNGKLNELDKFIINFEKKKTIKRVIKVDGKTISEYLDLYEFIAIKASKELLVTISIFSHEINASAIHKLSKNSNKIKCSDFNINLKTFITYIEKNYTNIEVIDGWFGKLKLKNLDSIKLQGDDVNKSNEWSTYMANNDSVINNITLNISYEKKMYQIFLSSKGALFFNDPLITEVKAFEICNYLIDIILEMNKIPPNTVSN